MKRSEDIYDELPKGTVLCKELSEKLGINRMSLSCRANRRGIASHYIKTLRHLERFFYPDEMEVLKEDRRVYNSGKIKPDSEKKAKKTSSRVIFDILPDGAVTADVLCEEMGLSQPAMVKRARLRGIGKHYLSRDNKRVLRFYYPEEVKALKERKFNPGQIKKGEKRHFPKKLYRVSVWDAELEKYVVKHCCLSKQSAKILVDDYKMISKKAIALSHNQKMAG